MLAKAQRAVGVGHVLHLVEAGQRGAHVAGRGERFLALRGKGERRGGQLVALGGIQVAAGLIILRRRLPRSGKRLDSAIVSCLTVGRNGPPAHATGRGF